VTTLTPRHNTTATDGSPRGPAQGFLPTESKLDAGITFRAWDRTAGTAGGRADTTSNGGSTAFSVATETVGTYFETRLYRSFNPNAGLNVYTLEQEFNALTSSFGYQDRSTSSFSGFTVFLSPIPGLAMATLYRMYYGIQFNANGTETDMGYRYLTTDLNEASFLETLGPANKRPQRDGCYFREAGVGAGANVGSGIMAYIYTTQQPGTTQMTQVYRRDQVAKPTRLGGTQTQTTPVQQEIGDHVFTTKTAFETSQPGTWRIEANRGFVRELSPNVGGNQQPARRAATSLRLGNESSLLTASSSFPPPWIIFNESRLPLGSGLIPAVAGMFFDALTVVSNSGRSRSPTGLCADSTATRRCGAHIVASPLSEPRIVTSLGAAVTEITDTLFVRWDEFVDRLP
jgi:hypothetical protein